MAARRRTNSDPVTQYARDVTEGRIVTGKLVRLACERHLRDLDSAAMRGLRWNLEAAQHKLDFFRFCRHSKGRWAGAVVELEPWQQFRIGSVFGWQKWDEDTGEWIRRFRVAYNEVARKNGKTTEAAGVGLIGLIADGESGAEVYSAATKRDQAKIVWTEAASMVRKSPDLAKRIRSLPGKGNMHVVETASKWEPLGADADTLDGLNPHYSIIDELHAHRTRLVWDVLISALGARLQPLVWAITTAGFDQSGICYENRSYAVQVLEGLVQDDTWFVYIATIDEGDDPFDERVWIKANPNLGVSIGVQYLRDQAKKARALPAALNNFLTKHLNVWTNQATRWIDLDLWDAQAGLMPDEEQLRGRVCYGGLDLSTVRDITALLLAFPDEEDPELVRFLCRFWVPEARVYDRENRYRDQYQAWVRQGFLVTTPGNAVDHDFIIAQVLRDAETFDLIDLNIDRLFQSHAVATKLAEEGLTVVGMGQGFFSMAAPMQEFDRRLLRQKLRHGGHPVLRWMAGNVAVKLDSANNMKPDKATSQGKIDGIVAAVMALDRAMRHQDEPSVYENRGVITG